MKTLYKLSTLVFVFAMLLTACNKDNIEEVTPEDPNYVPTTTKTNNLIDSERSSTTSTGVEMACLQINYPFDMVLESEETITSPYPGRV